MALRYKVGDEVVITKMYADMDNFAFENGELILGGKYTIVKVWEAYNYPYGLSGADWCVNEDMLELAPNSVELVPTSDKSLYEQAAALAPKLWTSYKDKLNEAALNALADVIVNQSKLIRFFFADDSDIECAFVWRDTTQGIRFWVDVDIGKYNKTLDTTQPTHIESETKERTFTSSEQQNSTTNDCEPNKAVSAPDFCNKAEQLMRERATTYDKDGNFEGERSASKIAIAFNAITGHNITESEAWLFLQIMKDVRQWSTKTYHADSAEDCVAYAALKAEALAKGE